MTEKWHFFNMATYKMILVGDTNVGKTSLITKYKSGMDNDFIPNTPNTIGCTQFVITKEINGIEVNASVWDTAGQEKYRALGPLYYRGSHACILVFDVTNEQSFKDLDEWRNIVQGSTSEDIIFYVVGSKTDLIPDFETQFERENAQEYAEKIGAKLLFTSSQDGSGIEELFNDIMTSFTQLQINEDGKIIKNNNKDGSCC